MVPIAYRSLRTRLLACGDRPTGRSFEVGPMNKVRVAMAAGLVAVIALPAPLAYAASCNGNSHQISLSAGGVTPGSGTKLTAFTFKVIYADSAGCAPNNVIVTVSGVGTYAMSRSATGGYITGVTFSHSLKLPSGLVPTHFRPPAARGRASRARRTPPSPHRGWSSPRRSRRRHPGQRP